ncbi:MAG: hypothetical protein NXI23_04010 [Bacteroidetes bacterium]|jgi:hypothetical protein|nr:hypothetical protein [Bacteroidota bacterium]
MQVFKKHIITTLSLVFLFQFFTFAQQNYKSTAMKWGDGYNQPQGTRLQKVISIENDGFYILRTKTPTSSTMRPKAYVEYFSKEMKLKKSNEMELKYKNKRRDFEDVISFGGELYLMTSFNNEVQKKNYLFKQKISKRSLVASKSLKMIAETEAKNKEKEGTFGFNISRDSSKLLVYNQLPYQKKSPERFALHIFDKDFTKLWTKNIILPYPDNSFTVEEYRIDQKGNVYILGTLFQDQAGYRRRGSPNYKYIILAYTKDGTDVQKYQIDLKNKFISDLTFRVADDGDLICSGFYSDRGTYSVKGTYFFRLNSETKEIYNENHKEFDFEFLTEYMSDKNKRKALEAERSGNRRKQPELYQYALDELILRSDGGAVLVAEQFYVYQEREFDNYPYFGYGGFYRSSYYNRRYEHTTYYNYNDILVVNIRPNGEIEWTARIPKRQETENDGGYFSSYAMSIVRDKLYFVFNDNGRNFDGNVKDNRLYNFNGRNSIIALAEVSKEGKVDIQPLYSNRDASILTRPKVCKQIGSKQMAIFGEGARQFRFGSLTFK